MSNDNSRMSSVFLLGLTCKLLLWHCLSHFLTFSLMKSATNKQTANSAKKPSSSITPERTFRQSQNNLGPKGTGIIQTNLQFCTIAVEVLEDFEEN